MCDIPLLFFYYYFTVLDVIGRAGSDDKEDEEEEEDGFEGTPKPMLPYSSMFLFGPTNP